MDYQKASELLKRGRDGRKKVGNNTYLYPRENGIAVRLHNTDVVLIRSDGKFVLNSGGWRTPTTKDRINSFAPVRVWQQRGSWFLGNGVEFYDGMVVDADGNPEAPSPEQIAAVERRHLLNAKIKAYIRGFLQDIKTNGLQPPSNGDCWGCLMKTSDGKSAFGLDHILTHFDEQYYVPSLLYRAIVSRGYPNPSLIYQLIQQRQDLQFARGSLRHYFKQLAPELLKLM